MPVFPLAQIPQPDGRFEISSEQRRHLLRVLRVKPGAVFEVSLPDGRRGQARLIAEGDSLHGLWLEESAVPALPGLGAWLGIGLIRMSRLEWLVEKATELGAERLSLLQLSQGSLPKSESISINKINRLRNISQETLKQCERNAFMRIDEPESLSAFLDRVEEAKPVSRILLRERAKAPLLPQVLQKAPGVKVLLVGPEGGFSEKECRAATAADFEPASLGPAVLRSETAALAALGYLHLQQSSEGRDR